jgi:ankyrin repeat protein
MTDDGLHPPSSGRDADGRKSQEIYELVNRLQQPQTPDEMRRIQALIDDGADLERRYNDGNQETVLEIALTREYTEAALLLVRNGADPNARSIQDCTPFIFCALKGNLEVLLAMFENGRAPPPDRDAYDSLGERKTALMVAAEGMHGEANTACALELIRRGADIHHKNNAGKSALEYAREKDPARATAMEAEALRLTLRNGIPQPVVLNRPFQFKSRQP